MREHGPRAARYALVGLANTGLYALLLWVFLWLDRVPYAVSVAIAFAICTVFHFLAHRHFTFGSTRAVTGQLGPYALMVAANYVLSVLVIAFCLDVVHVSKSVASLASAGTAAVAGYFLSSWVYRS